MNDFVKMTNFFVPYPPHEFVVRIRGDHVSKGEETQYLVNVGYNY